MFTGGTGFSSGDQHLAKSEEKMVLAVEAWRGWTSHSTVSWDIFRISFLRKSKSVGVWRKKKKVHPAGLCSDCGQFPVLLYLGVQSDSLQKRTGSRFFHKHTCILRQRKLYPEFRPALYICNQVAFNRLEKTKSTCSKFPVTYLTAR